MENDDSLYFKQVSLFANLPDEDLRALMAVARKRTFRAGEVIFHREDVGQVLYVLKEGKVNICLMSPEGQAISLVVLGKGDFFGELAILDGLPLCWLLLISSEKKASLPLLLLRHLTPDGHWKSREGEDPCS